MPRSRTETSPTPPGRQQAGPRHAGQVEAEAAVGDARGCDREIDRKLEPDDLAAVDRLYPPIRGQGVEQREATTGGRVLAVFLDRREGRIPVGHVDPDAVRKRMEGDAHWGRRVQHGVGHQSDVKSAAQPITSAGRSRGRAATQ